MAGFKVKIGADTIELTKALGELQKDLAALKKQLASTTNAQDIVKLNQAIAQTSQQIKSISSAQNIKAINRDMKELPIGFNQAGFAVGNFSRIVQDAPFALLSGNLIAVSNNIDPMIQSFVQLKQQTGSVGAAFKALGSNLVGSGGLLLGFSLVNAAITFFSARAMYAKDKAKELADTIRDTAQVQGEAAASVAGTIAQVQALASVISNTNSAYNDRKRALEELKEINKSYFGDLKLEDAATSKLTNTINEYSKAIVNAAIQKEFSQEIAKVAKEVFDAEQEFDKATTRYQVAQKALASARNSGRLTGREGVGTSREEANANAEVIESFNERSKAGDKVTELLTRQILLTNGLNKAIQDGLKFKDLDSAKTKKETDLLKQRIDALQKLQSEAGLTLSQQVELAQLEIQLVQRDSIKLGFTAAELQERIQAIINRSFTPEQLTSRLRIRVIGELDASSVGIDRQQTDVNINDAIGLGQLDTSKIDSLIAKMQAAAAAKKELLRIDEAEQFAAFITDQLGPVFTDLFSNLVSDSQNAFSEFAKAVGSLIKRLLAAAAAAATLSLILNAIFPGLGGTGKASFGAIFGQLTGLKFADGGITQGPTAGFLAKVHPNEAIIPLSKLSQIIGTSSNGGAGGQMTARIVDGGRDLILILNQANKTFGRNF